VADRYEMLDKSPTALRLAKQSFNSTFVEKRPVDFRKFRRSR
jgi:hypothetical protein